MKEIHARLPNTHLVMHGSSSVPQEFLAEIRKFGGEMRETYGVPVKEIQTAIKHGVRKVNVDTDIRLAMTAAIRRFIFENPSEFDPRAFMKAARQGREGNVQVPLPRLRLRRSGREDPPDSSGCFRPRLLRRHDHAKDSLKFFCRQAARMQSVPLPFSLRP